MSWNILAKANEDSGMACFRRRLICDRIMTAIQITVLECVKIRIEAYKRAEKT
jgi:hypothetical protein